MRLLCFALCSIAVSAIALNAFAQAPVIESGGVQNAASGIASSQIAPQMWVAIKGRHLASSTETASAYPLPTSLGGAKVAFNGVTARLLYASPVQINAEVPSILSGMIGPNPTSNVVVTTAAGSSDPYEIAVNGSSVGIFTQGGTGCGQAIAFNIHLDGSPLSLNTPQNSLDPNKDFGLAIFLTGLGDFADRIDGVPYIYNPLDNLASSSTILTAFGDPGVTSVFYVPQQYLGPAPDTVGVDQINVQVPPGAPQGCAVPMYVLGNSASQIVGVSIHSGGGSCVDPPDGTLGVVTLQQTSVSGAGGVTKSAAITAQFVQADGLSAPPYQSQNYGFAPTTAPSAICNDPETLDAGTLTLTAPGIGSVILAPSSENGRIAYGMTPASGTLQPGAYRLAGRGGSQVGAFTAETVIPAPIAITTDLQPGANLLGANAFVFTWTGGTAASVVTVELVTDNWGAISLTGAETGSQTMPIACGPAPISPCLPPGAVGDVIVTQSPANPSQPTFTAPGLGMGGQIYWQYTFVFKGVLFYLGTAR